jgi:4-hydroxy-3-methylbut-2-enyl diphosphate reductase
MTAAEQIRPALDLLIAAPRGFCAGVDRAIIIVERALEIYGPPVYVRHEIVHNKYVVEACGQGRDLRRRTRRGAADDVRR